jgi:GDP-L-fucose synthase
MPTNLYGPGDNYHPSHSHVLAAMLNRYISAKSQNLSQVTCWGTGEPMREFLHCEDLAEACIYALENWDPSAKNAPLDDDNNPLTILNVGTGKDISIKNLSSLISELVGFEGITKWDKSKPDGTPKKQLDISRISQLGWKPKISLKTGIKRTIKELLSKK